VKELVCRLPIAVLIAAGAFILLVSQTMKRRSRCWSVQPCVRPAETGLIPNGFALAFNGRDATDTRSELGARFDRVLALYTNAVLALRGRVAWAHDWVSDPTLTPLFQTLPGASFIVNGATPAQNTALTSAGAELRLANGITLLAKFDGEFASHSSTYAGTGTFRYRW
jgi:outer membrane autotransporter protein